MVECMILQLLRMPRAAGGSCGILLLANALCDSAGWTNSSTDTQRIGWSAAHM